MAVQLKCPHCGHDIEISDVLAHQIEERIRAETETKYKKQFEEERKSIEEKVRVSLEKGSLKELEFLKKELEESNKKVDAMREEELKLRQERTRLLEKEKELELQAQRKIDEERAKIEESVLKQAAQEHRLNDLAKEKRINDLQTQLEEALRRTRVGSQQLQGEVLELDLEETFRTTFKDDVIEPIGKGVTGADIRQIVKSPKGVVCGTILWEMKRTKAWSDGWCTKLKDDLRTEKANIPVIVSSALPQEAENGFGVRHGVWVTNYLLVIPLAMILRKTLLDAGFERTKAAYKEEKADYLYEYVTSHEFKQQIEALVEVYTDLHVELQKEKAAYERIWKKREGQITRMINSTANVVGSIQGRVGQTAFQIKGLDIFELDSGED